MTIILADIEHIADSQTFARWVQEFNEAADLINVIKSDFNGLGIDLTLLTTADKTGLVPAINELDAGQGDLSTLSTADKTSLVAAINEVEAEVGVDLSLLTTTDKSSLVNAINELHAEHGDLSTLTTVAKSTFVAAINELEAEIGTDLSLLDTTDKSSIIAAINEVNANADTNTTNIGSLAALTTTDQTSAVAAINELDGEIGVLSSLTTTDKSTLVAAINEVDQDIGTLASLTTTVKTSAVNAINELDGEIGVLSSLTTTDKSTLVAAINEVFAAFAIQATESVLGIMKLATQSLTNAGVDDLTAVTPKKLFDRPIATAGDITTGTDTVKPVRASSLLNPTFGGTTTSTAFVGDGSGLTGLVGGGPSLGTLSVIRTNAPNIQEDIDMWELNVTVTADTGADTLSAGTDDDYANGYVVQLETTGTLPAGLAIETDYYVVGITATTLQLALTFGGSAIVITDTGTGTHTLYKTVNGMSVGPMTIEAGFTVDIKEGSTWVIV